MSSGADPRSLLAALVAIPSPSGSEAAIADFVVALLESWRIDCERIGHSVVATVSQ